MRHERNGHRDASCLGVARHGRHLAPAPHGEGRDRGRRRARRCDRGGRAALVALHRAQRGLPPQPRARRALAGLDRDARPAALVRPLARADRRCVLGHGRRRADRVRLPRESARAPAAHLALAAARADSERARRRRRRTPPGLRARGYGARPRRRRAHVERRARRRDRAHALGRSRRSCSRSATTWSPCAATTSSR